MESDKLEEKVLAQLSIMEHKGVIKIVPLGNMKTRFSLTSSGTNIISQIELANV